jgi:hypothetical protein
MIAVGRRFATRPVSRVANSLGSIPSAKGLSVSCHTLALYAAILALYVTSPLALMHRALADEASANGKRHHSGLGSLSPSSPVPHTMRALTIRRSAGLYLCPDPNDAGKRCPLFNGRAQVPLGPGSPNILDAPNLLMPPQVPLIDINQPPPYKYLHIASALDGSFKASLHVHLRFSYFTHSHLLPLHHIFTPGLMITRR